MLCMPSFQLYVKLHSHHVKGQSHSVNEFPSIIVPDATASSLPVPNQENSPEQMNLLPTSIRYFFQKKYC